MHKNDWYDAVRYALLTNNELLYKEPVRVNLPKPSAYEFTKQLIEEQIKEAVEYCNNDVKHTANIFEILKEERMTKVDKLTMCLQDIAKRYNLDFEAEYDSVTDVLGLRYKRFNYHSRNMEAKDFYFERSSHLDIKHTLDNVEINTSSTFKLREKKTSFYLPKIKNVIFNDPATIVFWEDGTKTVVKAKDETFDPEKGLAMAISKKALGNQGNYCNEFKKWIPEEKEENKIIGEFSVPGSIASRKIAAESFKPAYNGSAMAMSSYVTSEQMQSASLGLKKGVEVSIIEDSEKHTS